MDPWSQLVGWLLLMVAAFVFGAICERLRQSEIIGYLLAGLILGPNVMHVIDSGEFVDALAELGVALLLFSIGLEFSWRRLMRMRLVALGGGSIQVVATVAVVFIVALLLGQAPSAAFALGAMLALSSTASVLKLLAARSEMESVHGRSTLAILLFQDMAVVPLVVALELMVPGNGQGNAWLKLLTVAGSAVLLIAGLFVLLNFLLPRLLGASLLQRNRELPVLLALIVGCGSAVLAHSLHISPALGAFAAGMMLAESPFATQVRADIGPFRTLLMALFFSSVGMLADPVWMLEHWRELVLTTGMVLLCKPLLTCAALVIAKRPLQTALASAICLAQIGEFAFMLAAVARGHVISEEVFLLVVSTTIITLLITPYLVAGSRPIARAIVARLPVKLAALETAEDDGDEQRTDTLIIGFGPAGQTFCEYAALDPVRITVIDLSPAMLRLARGLKLDCRHGDATRPDVLEHLRPRRFSHIIVTIPDPTTARRIIMLARAMAPHAIIIVRSRYHIHRLELGMAGANIVLDEESEIGRRMAEALDPESELTESGHIVM